jgi:hypothetical protein
MRWTKSQKQNKMQGEENVMQQKNFLQFENLVLLLIGGGRLEG